VNAREEILARVRAALRDVPPGEQPGDVPVPRDYLHAHVSEDPGALADLLAANLTDYRAHVHRTSPVELPDTIADLLVRRGSTGLAVPPDLPEQWLTALPSTVRIRTDQPERPERPERPDQWALGSRELDAIDSVLTGCALAIAETGTLILQAGPTQGRRILTLIPDHHICVVHAPDQIVASLPQALPRLEPTRPQTWISGPSATSDIELSRVEGVHGPRTLDVIIVAGTGTGTDTDVIEV
jgi:L-lactate dehydrogenase complex protein LldG